MPTSKSTLRSIALEQPASIRVFERLHLDYCCGGSQELAEACAQKSLDANEVLAQLAEAASSVDKTEPDLTQATLSALIRYIVATHHAYIYGELPRLLPLAGLVAAKHGPHHPECIQLEAQLGQLAGELLSHLNKEEKILFPYIEALEESHTSHAEPPKACFGTVESPIQAMLREHEAAAALLEQMRTATQEFAPPEDACPSLVGLYHGLAAFERDLHRHVHLENNLLFPRAIALERLVLVAR
jgi:regulator of cell morphogenesis and NO signaling